MTTTEAFAPAKINLTLHVTGQRNDGYHLLDSLVVFADLGDTLRFEPGSDLSIEVGGAFAKGVPADARNLIWQAAETIGWTGRITLTKNLPHGAGIGGGSSDAAAVLRALGDVTPAKALSLGADVPVCMRVRPQRMQGIGEVLTPVAALPSLAMVLVNPGVAVSTPEVFRKLLSRDNAPMATLPLWRDTVEFVEWLRLQRNDMQIAATALVPEIATVLGALGDSKLARMSGSGSTCWGIYTDTPAALAAATRITDAHPDWWVRATTIGGSP